MQTAKQRILETLTKAAEKPYTFYGYPLPNGFVPTGILHHYSIAGTSARTRISELNKRGIHIESCRIDNCNGKPMLDKNGNYRFVYVYRLLTPSEKIDFDKCERIEV